MNVKVLINILRPLSPQAEADACGDKLNWHGSKVSGVKKKNGKKPAHNKNVQLKSDIYIYYLKIHLFKKKSEVYIS